MFLLDLAMVQKKVVAEWSAMSSSKSSWLNKYMLNEKLEIHTTGGINFIMFMSYWFIKNFDNLLTKVLSNGNNRFL